MNKVHVEISKITNIKKDGCLGQNKPSLTLPPAPNKFKKKKQTPTQKIPTKITITFLKMDKGELAGEE